MLLGCACEALAAYAADDALRAALQRERAVIGVALARFDGVEWSQSKARPEQTPRPALCGAHS